MTRKRPVWPAPGKAEVSMPEAGGLAEAGALPVRLARIQGAGPDKVAVETLAPETARVTPMAASSSAG
ncbi:hypothetical protein FXF51_45125 [Nonomuraea sp. PA05]|uniref:hypothetical protein n=1 Tax=Nonomuraea sp. PA05 TaxID=2604466 RepID=UPI0011DBCE48|nr:hypothetical protein [Nonomuraea sp. PA05]TYB56005.1 hypothetical protein FXF51_45125 [Nonomuraea sp. PA05]